MDRQTRRADFRRRLPAIRRVLLERWDPVGLRDEPEAHDEYDGYAAALYGLLARGATDDVLATYLLEVETRWMGIAPGASVSFGHVIHALRDVGVGTAPGRGA